MIWLSNGRVDVFACFLCRTVDKRIHPVHETSDDMVALAKAIHDIANWRKNTNRLSIAARLRFGLATM
jgi:hypothetical protein